MRGGQKGQSGSAELLPPQNAHGHGQGHLNEVENVPSSPAATRRCRNCCGRGRCERLKLQVDENLSNYI